MNSIQDKYQKIMEVISDKTLSFWCEFINRLWDRVIFWKGRISEWEEYRWFRVYRDNKSWATISEIIWHPLHIWDVLDWIEKTEYDEKKIGKLPRWKTYIRSTEHLRILWKDKRLPLSPTDEELIDYIYNLI